MSSVMKRSRGKAPPIERDTSDLPCEVIYQTLSLLPAKSLLRFRSVSKPWRDVISDPKFIKDQLIQSTHFDRQKLFVSSPYSDCFYSINYETNSSDCAIESLRFPEKKYQTSRVWGSCNGLVLLRDDVGGMFVLWNPSIRVHKKFHCEKFPIASSLTGLCYDPSTDDYKIVFTTGFQDTKIVIFSIQTSEYKEIEFRYVVRNKQSSVLVNGALHWNVIPRNDSSSRLIVYLDLGQMKIKEVLLPKYWTHEFCLFTMGGRLCAYYLNYEDNVVVWKMEKYGDKESWIWEVICVPKTLTRSLISGDMKKLCITNEGECVTAIGKDEIAIYNRKKNSTRSLPIVKNYDSMDPRSFITTVTFLDSLVSPTGVVQSTDKIKS